MEGYQSFSERYTTQVDDIYDQALGLLDRRMIAEEAQTCHDSYDPAQHSHINDVLRHLISSTHHLADVASLRQNIRICIASILSEADYGYTRPVGHGYVLELPERVSMRISSVMSTDARYDEYRQILSHLRSHAAILRDLHERIEHFAFHIIDQYTTLSYPYRDMHRKDIDGEWSDTTRLIAQDAQKSVVKDTRSIRKINNSLHLDQKLRSLDPLHLKELFADDDLFYTWQKNITTAPSRYQLFTVAKSLLLIMSRTDRQIGQSMDPSTLEACYVRQYVYARTVLDICAQIVYP